MKASFPTAFGAALVAAALAACTQLMGAPEPADGPRSINGAAGAIYVDDGGDGGLPVVFLHSFAGDSSQWASQLDHLRHQRRALALDLRGHGKSARPRDLDYSMRAFVGDLETVVDRLKLAKFVLVGHSLGAAVANAYAGAHPERVAGLVLVGPPGRVPPQSAAKTVALLQSDYESTVTRQMEEMMANAQRHVRTDLLGQLANLSREDAVPILRALLANDPLPAFDRYKGPRLIIYSASTDVGGLQEQRPDTKQLAFEGTSHWPHLDKPKEFNLALDEFLAGLRAP